MGELSEPPFRGIVETTQDALLLLEAARRGIIPRVSRRFTEKERALIQSGAIFIFHEEESKIKRWTDGLVWSPSRILGNFLIYRELEKRDVKSKVTSFSNVPGGKPKTASSSKHDHAPANDDEPDTKPYSLQGSIASGLVTPSLDVSLDMSPEERRARKIRERQLVGSLTASFRFKEKGLIKKTMSMTINGYSQHLISYYSLEDALCGRLRAPSTLPELSSLEIGSEFLDPEQFRFPPKTQIGPDGLLRYRGEPDMQEEALEEDTTPLPSPPLGSASTSSARPSSSKSRPFSPTEPSQDWPVSQSSSSRQRPASSSSHASTSKRRQSAATQIKRRSSQSVPDMHQGYLADQYPQGAHPSAELFVDIPGAPPTGGSDDPSYPGRPSSPSSYLAGGSSGSYPARTGRMYHPYAGITADYGEPGPPARWDGGRRPSLRGQYSFDQPPSEHAPHAMTYAGPPGPPRDPQAAVYNPHYGYVAPGSSYAASASTYAPVSPAYPAHSPYHPSPYETYAPPPSGPPAPCPPPPGPPQPPATYYEDSPLQSPIEGQARSSHSAIPPHPQHYSQPPPSAGFYQGPPRPTSAPRPYAPLYSAPLTSPGAPPPPPPSQQAPRSAPHPGWYQTYPPHSNAHSNPPPPPGLGIYESTGSYGAPIDPQPYPQPPPSADRGNQHQPPPPPPPDGPPPYAGWGYGD